MTFKSDDNSKVDENSDQNMLMDQEDNGELNSPSISYQNTAPDTEIPTELFHQKTSENCDKNCEITANSEKQQCTPTITNITPVKLRITVKSEKDLIEPSKSVLPLELVQEPSKRVPELEKSSECVLELEKSSNSVPELVQKTSKSVPELIQKPSESVPELEKTSKSVPELVQKPSETVQELQKPSYNLELDLDPMEESNIQDPDLDQINVVDQIIATRKTAQ